MEALKEALKKRRAKGFEISISIEPKEEEGKTDLAPPGAESEGMMEEEYDPQMEEAEMEDLKSRPPRGLGDRAKLSFMNKK